MLLYAITDRRAAPGDGSESSRRDYLLRVARRWAEAGVDYVQVREKDLAWAELAELVGSLTREYRESGASTRLLLNCGGREQEDGLGQLTGPEFPGVLAQMEAAGVHVPGSLLRGAEAAALADVMARLHEHGRVASVACHSVAEVERARRAGADLAVFAPVFEKPLPGGKSLPGAGLAGLAAACSAAGQMAVIALGGVTVENAAECVRHGAAGVAGIRLFADEAADMAAGWQRFRRGGLLPAAGRAWSKR